jgi:hypothetical protein
MKNAKLNKFGVPALAGLLPPEGGTPKFGVPALAGLLPPEGGTPNVFLASWRLGVTLLLFSAFQLSSLPVFGQPSRQAGFFLPRTAPSGPKNFQFVQLLHGPGLPAITPSAGDCLIVVAVTSSPGALSISDNVGVISWVTQANNWYNIGGWNNVLVATALNVPATAITISISGSAWGWPCLAIVAEYSGVTGVDGCSLLSTVGAATQSGTFTASSSDMFFVAAGDCGTGTVGTTLLGSVAGNTELSGSYGPTQYAAWDWLGTSGAGFPAGSYILNSSSMSGVIVAALCLK